MTRLVLGCLTLAALTLTTSCAEDASRKEAVAPSAVGVGSEMAANRDNSASDAAGIASMRFVEITDDCDPDDPAWSNAPGGCIRQNGTVSLAEFNDELDSPHSTAVVGHESWRNEPPYGGIQEGQTIHVRNTGGRPHTFTKVAEFGGGRAQLPSPFNRGLTPVEECQTAANVPPGGRTQVSGLAPGNHRFMCCNHPWMRAVVEVRGR